MQLRSIVRGATATLVTAFSCGMVWAAPPTITLQPGLDKKQFVGGHWSPITVTLTNKAGDDAIQGEVEVTLEDGRSGMPLATYTRPIALGRGAGSARATVYAHISQYALLHASVRVLKGTGGNGEVIARRLFDQIATGPSRFTVLAVSPTPDALADLEGERLGVMRENGVMRIPKKDSGQDYNAGDPERSGTAIHVVRVTEPSVLPDRAIGYDAIAAVYLDANPDAFSDAQASALRAYVADGGVLVASGPRWQSDVRFKDWIPAASSEPAHFGRGTIAAPPRLYLSDWRQIFASAVTSPSLGKAVTESDYSGYNSLSSAVSFAPGMAAPSFGYIGLFLVGYLVLLVPVNYAILKRLDKREWSWATVPALVMVFSLGAYGFGFATKGSSLFQNTATIVEMGPDSGDATIHGAVGVFAPTRARYDVRVNTPDAMIREIGNYSANDAYGPLTVAQTDGKSGATAQGAEISMWAMRVFNIETSSVKMGDGVRVRLHHERNRIAGTVENRTGHDLYHVYVGHGSSSQSLNILHTGEKKTVTLSGVSGGQAQLFQGQNNQGLYDPNVGTSRANNLEAIQYNIKSNLAQTLNNQSSEFGDDAYVTAWTNDVLVPVHVDGKTIKGGANVNAILVHARIEPAQR